LKGLLEEKKKYSGSFSVDLGKGKRWMRGGVKKELMSPGIEEKKKRWR